MCTYSNQLATENQNFWPTLLMLIFAILFLIWQLCIKWAKVSKYNWWCILQIFYYPSDYLILACLVICKLWQSPTWWNINNMLEWLLQQEINWMGLMDKCPSWWINVHHSVNKYNWHIIISIMTNHVQTWNQNKSNTGIQNFLWLQNIQKYPRLHCWALETEQQSTWINQKSWISAIKDTSGPISAQESCHCLL